MLAVHSDRLAAAAATITGAGIWELLRHFVNRRDVLDDPAFWQIGYPLTLAAALVLGLVWRDRPWRWVVALMCGQAFWSLAVATYKSGMPNLFPLTLLMFAVLGLPCLLTAYAGQWIGNRLK
jgi:hypothetical protein